MTQARRKPYGLQYGWLYIGLIVSTILWWSCKDNASATNAINTKNVVPKEPQFVKEGELTLYDAAGQVRSQLDIEIADTPRRRELGLMYRRSMPDTVGMLFVFEQQQQQAFWMKNTFISLDILYINNQNQVVSITPRTVPLTETSVPSKQPAIYVLEVIGGYCEQHGIQEGDLMEYKRTEEK